MEKGVRNLKPEKYGNGEVATSTYIKLLKQGAAFMKNDDLVGIEKISELVTVLGFRTDIFWKVVKHRSKLNKKS